MAQLAEVSRSTLRWKIDSFFSFCKIFARFRCLRLAGEEEEGEQKKGKEPPGRRGNENEKDLPAFSVFTLGSDSFFCTQLLFQLHRALPLSLCALIYSLHSSLLATSSVRSRKLQAQQSAPITRKTRALLLSLSLSLFCASEQKRRSSTAIDFFRRKTTTNLLSSCGPVKNTWAASMQ